MKKNNVLNKDINTENPWLNARRSWSMHVAGLISQKQLWQVIAIISLLIAFTSVASLSYIASQSKFIPLVFKEDATGNILSVTKADKVADANLDDFRNVAHRFIENIRLVTIDKTLQRKAILQAYAYLSPHDRSALKANEYLNGSNEVNPFNRALKETVSIDIRSVLQLSKESWQVDWLETTRNNEGALACKPQLMRAVVNLFQNVKKINISNSEVLMNPHFIFVKDFNWSKQNASKG